MAYVRSIPLDKWLQARREAINTLAAAHAAMGEVDGPGRPLEIGRPVGHAYVLRLVTLVGLQPMGEATRRTIRSWSSFATLLRTGTRASSIGCDGEMSRTR